MIPLLHDFAGETVLVFGGGPVGARKARRFAREARVLVVSPEFADRTFRPDEGTGSVELVRAAPQPADVPDWFDRASPALAVAATADEAVNEAVETAATERGVLVNRADHSGGREPGSVVVPATVREDPVVVSVATGGASPALSKHLRERLEAELAGAGELAELTAELREDLKKRGIPPEERRAAVRRVVRDERLWKHLGTGGAKSRRRADEIVSDMVGDYE